MTQEENAIIEFEHASKVYSGRGKNRRAPSTTCH
ncbi:hypothetical protein GSD1FS_0220 [Bifidobacterium sp. GSD1FS]|uniref:Uncharacterized protein n=1 Tax=Bifidobacterium canis TaxID=2610880 RepID=A0A7K1J2Q7_9BIFI|nr:hypothetical protein [Bifidobacterium canis]